MASSRASSASSLAILISASLTAMSKGLVSSSGIPCRRRTSLLYPFNKPTDEHISKHTVDKISLGSVEECTVHSNKTKWLLPRRECKGV